MAQYDPKVIHGCAEALYVQARGILVSWTVLGVALGGGAAFTLPGGLGSLVRAGSSGSPMVLVALGALLGGLLGYFGARSRAAALRLQAQMALCQAQIEENTRRPA